MTLLKIEVKTVTGKYHPEDMIKIWAPALRSNGDTVVSTAPEIVKLVQGKAQVELLPGPARIQIMCGGTLDNAVRKVTIPDAAEASLRAVLEEGFDWEPEIVTLVMRYRNEAVAASTSAAEEAADAANSAKNAATSAGEAGLSASASATSAQSAAASKTAASTSATNAATSATNAATSAGEAATSEDTSLDAAAAAIAAAVSVAQFQGHGFPNGHVAAPVGSIYTDLDATNGAIRWIKATGTGNTGWQVEYGDTGRRAITDLSTAESGTLILSRHGDIVHLRGLDITFSPTAGTSILTLPYGFRPSDYTYDVAYGYWSSEHHRAVRIRPGGLLELNSVSDGGVTRLDIIFTTNNHWPTSLPGTPI